MISTRKSPRRGSGKGSCHIPPCGLLLGCLKGQNLGNQFCFQTAAQFFINVANNDFLNHTAPNPQGGGYAVFGKVTAGQNVVDEIARVPTSTHGFYGDVPVDDIVIEKAEIL